MKDLLPHKLRKLATITMLALQISAVSAQSFFTEMPQAMHSDSWIDLMGSFGDQRFSPLSLTTMHLSVDLDLTEDFEMLTFRRTEFVIHETISLTNNFVVGTNSVPISGTITFDCTLIFLDENAFSIEWEGGDEFSFNFREFEIDGLPNTENTILSGRYSFSGPTESVAGDFSYNPFWERGVNSRVRLDTSNHPNEIIFNQSITTRAGRMHFEADEEHTIFDGTIDGVDLLVASDWTFLQSRNPLQLIPEPASAFAIGVILIGFIAFRKSRNREKFSNHGFEKCSPKIRESIL